MTINWCCCYRTGAALDIL